MELLRFAEKFARFLGKRGFGGRNHPQEKFRFFCFLYAPPDDTSEVLFRNAFVRFTIIATNTRTATDQLINQSIVCWISRYPFRESNNRFTEPSGALLQIKRMLVFSISAWCT